MEGIVDLFLNSQRFENWLGPVVKFQPIARSPRDFPHQLVHSRQRLPVIANHFVDLFSKEIAHGPLYQIRFLKNAARRRLLPNESLYFRSLIEQKTQIAHKISGALTFTDGTDDHAQTVRNFKFTQNFPEPIPFLWIFDLARDAAAIAKRHQDKIAASEAQVRGHARAFRSDRAFCHLHDYLRADRIDIWNIFGRNAFPLFFRRPIDFFDAAVKGSGNGVPKMEKGVFLEADVDEHRLQPHFDVLDFALVNAADDVARVAPLDAVFLKPAILEQRHAPLEFFHAENEFVASLPSGKTEKFFYFV